MNVAKLSNDGAVEILEDICTGLIAFVQRNPTQAKLLLETLQDEVLDPLAEDDFWGPEGWSHALFEAARRP